MGGKTKMFTVLILNVNRALQLVTSLRASQRACWPVHMPATLGTYVTASFDTVLHITHYWKTLYEKVTIVVKQKKYRYKRRNKLYLRKLGPVVAFSVYPGPLHCLPLHGHFIRFFGSLFVWCCFQSEARQMTVSAVSTHKSLPHQRTAHRFNMKALNP